MFQRLVGDTAADTWLVQDADHRVDIGASSRDIRLSATVPVTGDAYADQPDADSAVEVWLAHPVGGPAIEALLRRVQKSMGDAHPKEEALATGWWPTCASASSPGSRSFPWASTTYRNWSRRCGRPRAPGGGGLLTLGATPHAATVRNPQFPLLEAGVLAVRAATR